MTCLFRFVFHFPCPACGTTRAIFSFLRGEFDSYFYYNAMALPLCFATFLMIFSSIKNIKILKVVSCIILFLNIPYYIFRLTLCLIP
ncbi:DUF2752 domain-containing protein [Treponema succinifaciens]|uniref:DUF2752 domain-containing protein n=1 Tax=Treponema succinifaciens TaxID=167 RepID=UPI0023F3252B|nr:DUF2752 domain-containing protein [Treponema succinifaciens]